MSKDFDDNQEEGDMDLQQQLYALSYRSKYSSGQRLVQLEVRAESLTKFYWSVLISGRGRSTFDSGVSENQADATDCITARLDESGESPGFTLWDQIWADNPMRPGEVDFLGH